MTDITKSHHSDSHKVPAKRGTKTRSRKDSGRLSASLLLLAATCGWIAVLFCTESSAQAWGILRNSALTTFCCCVCHYLASTVAPRDPLVFSHFVCGMFVYLAYMGLYVVEPELFLRTWRSLYFGFYVWDICMIIVYWRRLFAAFRHFYTIHHIVSFAITGAWLYSGGEWLDYIILGLVIWLSSDLWVYALSAYRAGPFKKLTHTELSAYRYKIFWVERAHRLLAYVLPLWMVFASGSNPSMLCLLVLGTGLANDVLDASFQWKAIIKARKQKQKPTVLVSKATKISSRG